MRFLNPPTVLPDGTCPDCGRPVDPGRAGPPAPVVDAAPPASRATGAAGASVATDAPTATESLPAVPWHFKALVGALAVYLGYRFFEMGEWIVRRI